MFLNPKIKWNISTKKWQICFESTIMCLYSTKISEVLPMALKRWDIKKVHYWRCLFFFNILRYFKENTIALNIQFKS